MLPTEPQGDQAKYQQAREELRRMSIAAGPGTRFSERELCVRFGVSRHTIRRAIDDLVAEGILRRQARSGVFVDRAEHKTVRAYCAVYRYERASSPYHVDFSMLFLRQLESEVASRGDRLFLASIGSEEEFPPTAYDADGIILWCSVKDQAPLHTRTNLPIPTIILLRSDLFKPGAGHVILDDYVGGAMAAQHLCDLGHTRLAFIGHAEYCEQERYRGACSVASALGYPPVNFYDHGTEYITAELLDPIIEQQITGVICTNDATAMAVVSALHKRGLDVPHDVSVVGFDDIPTAVSFVPPLTTVRIPVGALAKTIVDELEQRAQQPERNVMSRTMLPMQLVIRESTAPPKF